VRYQPSNDRMILWKRTRHVLHHVVILPFVLVAVLFCDPMLALLAMIASASLGTRYIAARAITSQLLWSELLVILMIYSCYLITCVWCYKLTRRIKVIDQNVAYSPREAIAALLTRLTPAAIAAVR